MDVGLPFALISRNTQEHKEIEIYGRAIYF